MLSLAIATIAGAILAGFLLGAKAALASKSHKIKASTPRTTRETKYGQVTGVILDDLAIFKGVPYAASTEGDGRFAPPKDPVPWTGEREAFHHGPSCWQITSDENPFNLKTSAPLSEDCLSLNIWAPKDASPGSNLPVYLFIHGGGFCLGSSSQSFYDGSALAKEGIIAITINYRLGAFGFMALRNNPNPLGAIGNWGVLDQIKALEWVRENISFFGGDPQKVTAGGESAGAMTIGAIMTSPLGSGLFRGAIMQSGSGLGFQNTPIGYGSVETATMQGRLLLAALRLKEDPESLFKLRRFDPAILSTLTVFSPEFTSMAPFSMAPICDGAVIPLDVQAAMTEDKLKNIKLLIGFNSDEATMFTTTLKTAAVARAMVTGGLGPDIYEALWSRFDPKTPEEEIELSKKAMGMGVFTAGVKRTADIHSRFSDVFMYRFEYASEFAKATGLGAHHACELPYVFGRLAQIGLSAEHEKRLSENIRRRWVDFIKTGNPNGEAPNQEEPAWPLYDPADPRLFRFDANLSVGPLWEKDDLDFVSERLYGPIPKN